MAFSSWSVKRGPGMTAGNGRAGTNANQTEDAGGYAAMPFAGALRASRNCAFSMSGGKPHCLAAWGTAR
eukprot:7491426-Lingulodinium_polyedra.AAC.1